MLGYFRSRAEAKLALADYNNDPYDIDAKKVTFAKIYELWSEEHFPKVSKSRISTYKTVFKQSKELHDLPFVQIKLRHLQAQIDAKSHISRMTLRHHKNVYRQLFKYAIKNEIVEKNHANLIELPQDSETKKDSHTIFTPDEIQILWDNVDKPNVDIALILIYSGMRIMELLQMPSENVHLTEQYMVGGNKTKAGKNRVIPIHDKILPLVAKRMSKGNTYLIKPPRSEVYYYTSFRKNVWWVMMNELGLNHTMHDTRHTFVSMMDSAGVQQLTIKKIAGHSYKDITDRYTHKEIRELVEAVNQL